MADDDAQFATLANGLNEDAKVARKGRRVKGEAVDSETAGTGEGVQLPGAVDGAGDPPAPVATAEDDDTPTAREELIEEANGLLIDSIMQADFAGATLVGDIRDAMLNQFKNRKFSWDELGSGDQRDVVRAFDQAAQLLVKRAAGEIARAGRTPIPAKLESYAEKGGIKITMTANGTSDIVLALHDAVGQDVLIVRADDKGFIGARGGDPAPVEEPNLPFSDDDRYARPAPGVEKPTPPAGPEGDTDLANAFDDDDTGEGDGDGGEVEE